MTSNELALPTRAGLVAERLRAMIQSGELPPGSMLRQNEIAERFGVSTTPVREAFAVLFRDGLVRQAAHRSVIVFQPSLDELAEIYEIRCVLEPYATELAAKKITPEQHRELEAIIAEMRKAKPQRYVELNRILHTRIYEIAARPRLADIVESLRKTSASYINLFIQRQNPDFHHTAHSQHEQIVDALGAGKGKEAAKVMRQHLQDTLKYVTSLVAESEQTTAAG
jgi:DNA-binding GntR family transcriptional regulator